MVRVVVDDAQNVVVEVAVEFGLDKHRLVGVENVAEEYEPAVGHLVTAVVGVVDEGDLVPFVLVEGVVFGQRRVQFEDVSLPETKSDQLEGSRGGQWPQGVNLGLPE